MSHFTKVNLGEVEDSAPKFGYGEVQEARFPGDSLGAEATGVGLLRVKPNCRQGFGHHHGDVEEIYLVTSGSGRFAIGDEVVDVRPLDAVRIAAGVPHRAEAGPDGLEFVAFGPPGEGEAAELLPDFWPGD